MKSFSVFLLLLCGFSAAPAQTKQTAPIVAETEPPVLNDKSGAGVNFALPEENYRKIMKQLSAQPNFIEIKKKPARLTADARFGLNLVIGGKNIGWMLDGDENRGFTLYADWNADGVLTNDSPVKFGKLGDTYLYRRTLTETIDGKKQKYPYQLKLELAKIAPPGETGEMLALKTYDGTMRRGILNVDNRRIAFLVFGSQGVYNDKYNNVYFDLNGDGNLDTKTRYSPEGYKISEKFVNIGDASYEFSVDRYGQNLTLKPLTEKLPERADLTLGGAAPDFAFNDLDGKARKISDFRGKIVLLDFWGLWCAPCVAEAPKLAEAYKKMKQSGFEVVSFDEGDKIENLRKFIGEKEMSWTHSQMNEELKKLYRIDRYPTYFLLDKEGKIVSNTMRPGEEMYRKIGELLEIVEAGK